MEANCWLKYCSEEWKDAYIKADADKAKWFSDRKEKKSDLEEEMKALLAKEEDSIERVSGLEMLKLEFNELSNDRYQGLPTTDSASWLRDQERVNAMLPVLVGLLDTDVEKYAVLKETCKTPTELWAAILALKNENPMMQILPLFMTLFNGKMNAGESPMIYLERKQKLVRTIKSLGSDLSQFEPILATMVLATLHPDYQYLLKDFHSVKIEDLTFQKIGEKFALEKNVSQLSTHHPTSNAGSKKKGYRVGSASC